LGGGTATASITVAPGADPATIMASLTNVGNRIAALQHADGGWYFGVDDTDCGAGPGVSCANTFGYTALGLLASYEHTGAPALLTAVQNAGNALVAEYTAENPKLRPYTSDVEFLVALGQVTGNATYTATATATSGLGVTFSIAGASSGVCSISTATVTFTGPGICTVYADQNGNGTYNAAPRQSQSFNVAAAMLDQTISFTTSVPETPTVGGTYNVAATASSGLTVTISIDASSDPGACSLAGATVSLLATGSCVIDANQAGNATYNAAPQVQQTFTIAAKQAQTITWASYAAFQAGASLDIHATTTSPNDIVYTSATPAACTISPDPNVLSSGTDFTVTFIGHGVICTIYADQTATRLYNAATRKSISFFLP
ncbi:MAG: hypothetical protein WCK58_16065, partial [Chloroflexota bacterium]